MQDAENEAVESQDARGPVNPETIALILADLDATARRFQGWVREQNKQAADRRAMTWPALVLHARRPANPALN